MKQIGSSKNLQISLFSGVVQEKYFMPSCPSVLMFAINSAYLNAYLALVFLTKEKWVWGVFVSLLLYARHKTEKAMVNIVFLRYRIYLQ